MNRSLPPSSGVMKPYPLASLNHLTVPVAMTHLPHHVHERAGKALSASRTRPSNDSLTQPAHARGLPKPVDDPAARQVVRGQLDPHAVAQHDADPVPLHPAAEVTERLVAVVELNPEHPAA